MTTYSLSIANPDNSFSTHSLIARLDGSTTINIYKHSKHIGLVKLILRDGDVYHSTIGDTYCINNHVIDYSIKGDGYQFRFEDGPSPYTTFTISYIDGSIYRIPLILTIETRDEMNKRHAEKKAKEEAERQARIDNLKKTGTVVIDEKKIKEIIEKQIRQHMKPSGSTSSISVDVVPDVNTFVTFKTS